jgi:hypothetical protein
MSNSQDDEVLQALKAELVAFLFNQSGERTRGTPSVAERLSETVTGQVRQDLQRELHAFHDQVEATLEQAQYAGGGGGLGSLLRQPLFLVVAVIALLSIGANIGLGLALLGRPAPATEQQTTDDASASADAVSDMALEPAMPDRKTQEDNCKKLTKPADRTKCLANIKTPAAPANAGPHH